MEVMFSPSWSSRISLEEPISEGAGVLATEILRPTGRRSLKRGEMLFSRGDRVESVHRIVRGRIRLERSLADGRVVIVHTATVPELLAEASLFSDCYHCDAIAEVGTVVEIEERSRFVERLAADPVSAIALVRWLSRQLRTARWLLELRNIRPARDRLLAYLQPRDSPAELRPNRPLRLIADELGIAAETLYRLLAELEETGQITRRGRSIRLVHRE